MKKILHIATGLGNGGAEAVLYRLCTYDRDNRHYVISLTDEGKYGPLLSGAGIAVTALGMSRGQITLRAMWRLWCAIRKIRPDVVQTWMYHANLLGGIIARLAGHRNVCWGIRQSRAHQSRDDRSQIPRGTILADRLSAYLSGWVPRRIICCAERAYIAHVEAGYDVRRAVVIPNGYDLSLFRPDPVAGESLRATCGLGTSEPVIGFVARYHPLKGHADLLRALARLHASTLRPACLLVGTGMDEANLELAAMVAQLGLEDQVHLLGPRSDIPAIMNALDLHVMSSVSEGFPNVLAEAMACGTPCVSTDVGDARAILGGIGRIVPARDSAKLAMAIAELLAERANSGWRAKQKAARRHVAQKFSLQRMIDDYRTQWFPPRPEAN